MGVIVTITARRATADAATVTVPAMGITVMVMTTGATMTATTAMTAGGIESPASDEAG